MCAPVLSIHNTASKTRRVGIGCVQDVHRGYALPENDSGCAPTARLSAESSGIYSRSTPPSNFEIGSSHHDKGGAGNAGDRRDVANEIKAKLLIERRADSVRSVRQ